MSIKKPAKPKFKKLPKAPKASASTEAWKRYENRLKSIEAENDKKIAEYKKKKSAYGNEMKQRERIKEKSEKIRSKLSGI